MKIYTKELHAANMTWYTKNSEVDLEWNDASTCDHVRPNVCWECVPLQQD